MARRSLRKYGWNYSSTAVYMITITTFKRKPFFGRLTNEGMKLSEIGKVVEQRWLLTQKIAPNIELGAFVVMPDHFHAIVYFKRKGAIEEVESNRFGPNSNNLASLVRGFKSGVTSVVKMQHPQFKWQARYHDKILFDEKDIETATNYILENPMRAIQRK